MWNWIGFVTHPLFGVALAIVSLLIAIALPVYQPQLTHFSRSRYKKALLADISLIDTYHVLHQSAMHSTMMVVQLHSSIIAFVGATGSILMIFGMSASQEFVPWVRLAFYMVFGPFALWLNFKAAESITRFNKTARVLMTPLVVLGDIAATLDGRKASILTDADKSDIRAKIDVLVKRIKSQSENALSPPQKGTK